MCNEDKTNNADEKVMYKEKARKKQRKQRKESRSRTGTIKTLRKTIRIMAIWLYDVILASYLAFLMFTMIIPKATYNGYQHGAPSLLFLSLICIFYFIHRRDSN